MKLYFSPGACSLAPHIVLREIGLPFDLEQVNFNTKQTASGDDYQAINPKGYVPALQFDNGQVLTEVAAIVQYLGDKVPEKNIVPPVGSMERYRLMEWLNFIATELHRTFSPLFRPGTHEETKTAVRQLLTHRFEFVAKQLESSDYLIGKHFTVADAYLFTVLSWAPYVKFDLTPWPVFGTYQARMAQRPAVQAALAAEGLTNTK
jgi:glutathione S-transferase